MRRIAGSPVRVNLRAFPQGLFLGDRLFGGGLAGVFGDLHRADVRDSGLFDRFGLLEQAVHCFPGEELVTRLHVITGSDLERCEQARDFGRGHFFQEDGGRFLDGGELVFDGNAHGVDWLEMKFGGV